MPSELWQRLRAARRYADLTQTQVAQAVRLTRSAVAQWESSDPNHRTRPTVEHLMVFSKLTRAPLEWLMNDASRIEDLYKLAATNDEPAPLAAFPSEHDEEEIPDVRVGGKVFSFARSYAEVREKMQKLEASPKEFERHLILVGAPATVHSVCTMAQAMQLIADHISQVVDRKQQ